MKLIAPSVLARRIHSRWCPQATIAATIGPWLLVVPLASAGVVTFDDLPAPTTRHSNWIDLAPLPVTDGFLFTSTNSTFQFPELYDRWAYYQPNRPWTGAVGEPAFANGVRSGNRAAYSPNYDIWQPSEYTIARADGGHWKFGGAWFTAIWAGISNELRVVGYSGVNMVFDVRSMITINGPTFVAPSDTGLEVDRIVITDEYTTVQYGVAPSGYFAMDDLQYELVPAPGGIAVGTLTMLALQRRRRA
jgi:hypothetical protein